MIFRHLVLLSLLALSTTAHAGAWLQPTGKGLAITQASYYTSSHFYDADGHRRAQPRFTKRELQPYVEYGLTPTLTLGGTAFLSHVSQSGDAASAVVDPEFFVRVPVTTLGTHRFSLEPRIKLPSFGEGDTGLRAGSRSTDGELVLLYGSNPGLISPRDYLDTRLAYRARNRGLSDQLRADIAGGFAATDHLTIIPALRTVVALSPDETSPFRQDGEQDSTFVKAELTASYRLAETRSVQLGVHRTVAGALAGEGTGIILGIAQEF